MGAADLENFEAIVTGHIPREWRGEIGVEEIERLSSANGRPAGAIRVVICAQSKLGRAQAMLSIGPYVTNDPAEWESGWEPREGGGWLFVAYEPSAEAVQPTLAEFADQGGPSASAKS